MSLGRAPQPIEHRRASPGDLAYRVAFDEPEYDVDGDGPYRKALIREQHLRPDPEPAEG
ncbi:hypothetical protein AB0442_21500 [Kitasatospora sp. NPDC085895]|uniref:hypothetical protein n=1 Tax=Kitasatospora sp. NPDC085895 TaxID=3155057 RepID=UPI00344BF0FD